MKACRHYSKGDTYISPSSVHPWNAWMYAYDHAGYLVYSSFQTGLMTEYLEHLRDSPKCRRELRITKKEVLRYLKDLEQEWNAIR